MSIKIVTDSTSDLPQDLVKRLGITVLPLYINIDNQGFLDGIEISRKDFYSHLPDYKTHPTTGTPGIDAITNIYKKLSNDGANQILSIHISKRLSATVNVAENAAKHLKQIPIVVRDSGQLSTGTGFQVETAARMALNGKKMDEIIQALDNLAERSFVAARLNTLEYLHRSGRMNGFMTGLGSLLQIKPILTMRHGSPDSVRVRTEKKANARLISMLEAFLPIERFVLLHTNAPIEAEELFKQISHLAPEGETSSMNITPVIGAHIGPKAIGFAVVSRNSLSKNKF